MDETQISPEEELGEVEAELASIKGQIAAAKARRIETGEFADPTWFAKANNALRHKQTRHQHLLRLVAARRKQGRAEQQKKLEAAFMQEARKRLDADMFWSILNAAQRISSGDE